jgi:hypothetical protein
MDTKIRGIPNEAWEDFKDAARDRGLSANHFLIELIVQEAKKWRKGEEARLQKRLDELRQGALKL